MADQSESSCGFVSVVGLPNAGKSTLVNALVGQKVSIVSRKVQTTRARVLGIVMHGRAQIILIDTPGIFNPKKPLEKAMVEAALNTLGEGDIIAHLVDASNPHALEHNQMLIQKLPAHKRCILVLNKTDQIDKPALLDMAQGFNSAFDYQATFMISALKAKGLEALLHDFTAHLPEGACLYDPDQVTDMPMRLMAAEITREKVFMQLHQELPYAIMIETESWENFEDGSLKIGQIIYVEKDSQKGIVLGKGGSRIKQIGEAARQELEETLERRVHLKLFVKLKENWSARPENYNLIGLETRGKV